MLPLWVTARARPVPSPISHLAPASRRRRRRPSRPHQPRSSSSSPSSTSTVWVCAGLLWSSVAGASFIRRAVLTPSAPEALTLSSSSLPPSPDLVAVPRLSPSRCTPPRPAQASPRAFHLGPNQAYVAREPPRPSACCGPPPSRPRAARRRSPARRPRRLEPHRPSGTASPCWLRARAPGPAVALARARPPGSSSSSSPCRPRPRPGASVLSRRDAVQAAWSTAGPQPRVGRRERRRATSSFWPWRHRRLALRRPPVPDAVCSRSLSLSVSPALALALSPSRATSERRSLWLSVECARGERLLLSGSRSPGALAAGLSERSCSTWRSLFAAEPRDRARGAVQELLSPVEARASTL